MDKKASKYGELDAPYIVAVNATGEYQNEEDAFDALFGSTPSATPTRPASTMPLRGFLSSINLVRRMSDHPRLCRMKEMQGCVGLAWPPLSILPIGSLPFAAIAGIGSWSALPRVRAVLLRFQRRST